MSEQKRWSFLDICLNIMRKKKEKAGSEGTVQFVHICVQAYSISKRNIKCVSNMIIFRDTQIMKTLHIYLIYE